MPSPLLSRRPPPRCVLRSNGLPRWLTAPRSAAVSASVPLAGLVRASARDPGTRSLGDVRRLDRSQQPTLRLRDRRQFPPRHARRGYGAAAAPRIPGGASARASRNACARHDRLPADGAVSGASPSPAALDHVGERTAISTLTSIAGTLGGAAALAARRVCRRPSGRAFPLGATRGRRDAARLRTRAAAGPVGAGLKPAPTH